MHFYPWITVQEVSSNEFVEEKEPSKNYQSNKESPNNDNNKRTNDKCVEEFLIDMEKHFSFIQVYDEAKKEL